LSKVNHGEGRASTRDDVSSLASNPDTKKDIPDKAHGQNPPLGETKSRSGDASASYSSHDPDTNRPKSLLSSPVDEATQHDIAMQQRLLASCERVNLLSMPSLTLDDYPNNWEFDQAKKMRDIFLMGGSVSLGAFIVALTGIVHPVIAGISFGVFVLCCVLAFTSLQSIVTGRATLYELAAKRNLLVSQARSHVQFLEGVSGLAWRCSALGRYNRHLYNNQFNVLIQYSKANQLHRVLSSPRHFRLYAQFVVEAQRAYKKLQTIYLSEGGEINLSH